MNGLDEIFEEIKKIEPEFRQSTCSVHGEYTEKGTYSIFSLKKNLPHWHGCDKCKAEKKELENQAILKKHQEDEQRRIDAKYKKAGIPKRFIDKSFETYQADTDNKTNALTVSRDYFENFNFNLEKGKGLIFSGKVGTGKSHLAIAIAKELMGKHKVLYTNALDAIRMIRDTWRKDSELSELDVLEQLSSIDLLIIDEVGVQYGTEGEQVLMFDIINRRYRDSRPTVLLTNLNASGLKEFLSDRSYDRLREVSTWVSFDWDSYRPLARDF